jgi:hypothetical protein
MDRGRYHGVVHCENDELVALGLLDKRMTVGRARGETGRAGGAQDQREVFGRTAMRISGRHGVPPFRHGRATSRAGLPG